MTDREEKAKKMRDECCAFCMEWDCPLIHRELEAVLSCPI